MLLGTANPFSDMICTASTKPKVAVKVVTIFLYPGYQLKAVEREAPHSTVNFFRIKRKPCIP
jgi:hypothetical protein